MREEIWSGLHLLRRAEINLPRVSLLWVIRDIMCTAFEDVCAVHIASLTHIDPSGFERDSYLSLR